MPEPIGSEGAEVNPKDLSTLTATRELDLTHLKAGVPTAEHAFVSKELSPVHGTAFAGRQKKRQYVKLSLSFLGAAGTVTGSKYLIENATHRILVDCGLFQGFRPLRQRNWEEFPVDPASISAVVLTRAHLDHSGHLQLLVRQGFRGSIFCSSATADLCEILLRDAGRLQENDAEYANRRGFSNHKPALPLYTEEDAQNALRLIRAVPFHQQQTLPGGTRAYFRRSGHILGAAVSIIAIALGSARRQPNSTTGAALKVRPGAGASTSAARRIRSPRAPSAWNCGALLD